MAFVIADRVQETTTSTGTGTITLAGASTGFQSFAAIGNGNNTYYTIAGRTTSEWEVGIGTYTSAGTTLSRDTVLSSSNSGSLVNFSAGTKDVFVTPPASRSALVQSAGSGLFAGTTAFTANGALYASSTTVVTSGTLPIASGGTNATATPTAGAIAYGTGTAYAFTTAGTSGQVLTSAAASAPTWTTATSANTASAIVQRDASGNFSAGTITATLSGNASTATNVAGLIANSATTYGGTATTTARSGYFGLLIGNTSSCLNVMADSTGNGGIYRESSGVWTQYYSVANTCTGFGGSTTASGYVIYANGSFYATGNVTAYSDERLKTNWRDLPHDFIERLAKVKHGTYDRIDEDITQDGVSAQSLQEVLPNSIGSNDEGMLGVNYGNAALVSAVALAKRVVEQEARIAKLEALVAKLTKD